MLNLPIPILVLGGIIMLCLYALVGSVVGVLWMKFWSDSKDSLIRNIVVKEDMFLYGWAVALWPLEVAFVLALASVAIPIGLVIALPILVARNVGPYLASLLLQTKELNESA